MNRKFKAPPAVDIKQWAKVQFLSDHGFRFGSILNKEGFRVPYPATLGEARQFVREYADAVGVGWLTEDGPPKGKRIPRGGKLEESARRAAPVKVQTAKPRQPDRKR
ncbi:MAG TPA: hypothetical protein VNW92_19575 [Polyangiaceae bacterium]|jgi:hypothetical protein|nr:hypothetical protein [Polyangiaceae bacterium]